MYPKAPVEEYDGYSTLCSAIIMRACVDYLDYKREEWKMFLGSTVSGKYEKHIKAELKKLRRFFLSDWFVCLADELDGQYLMEQLDNLFEEMVRNNDFSRIDKLMQPHLD